jgi:hypothetical protein
MPVVTQKDAVLSLTLDGTEIACQVIDGSLEWPGKGEPTTIPVACGGDPVSEPGSPTNGSISGEVFKDTSDGGVTRMLIQALEADTEMTYIWTENDGTPEEMTVTGKCRVNGHTQTFSPDKLGRHPLALSVSTAATTFGTP